jgi:oligopeptide transport system substrate-binding protein
VHDTPSRCIKLRNDHSRGALAGVRGDPGTVALLAAVAVGALLTACSDRVSEPAVLERALTGEPDTFDPQLAVDTNAFEVLRDVFEGLTSEGPRGEVVPGVADRWTVSTDGRLYVFHLRADARWSNGDLVRAQDFRAALTRAVDPRTAAPNADLLRVIRGAPEIIAGKADPSTLGVRVRDAANLEIELNRPAPYVLSILANAVAYPVHGAAPDRHAADSVTPAGLVSNGAYRLTAHVLWSHIRLERNDYYWDRRHVAIRSVEYLPVDDIRSQFVRYRAGTLDLTSSLAISDFEWARRNLSSELQVRPRLAVIYFSFAQSHEPFSNHRSVAEALSLALDRETLTTLILKAGQVPAYSFVPPGIVGYVPPQYSWTGESKETRLARARALYHESGYSAAKPLRVRMLFSRNDSVHGVALAAAAQWKELLGVECDLRELEFRSFLAARADQSGWDISFDDWSADYPDAANFLDLFRSQSPQNNPRLADPELDRLLALADADPVAERRTAILQDAERRLLADDAIAPVYFTVTRRLVKPRVRGAELNPMNHNYSKFLEVDAYAAPH